MRSSAKVERPITRWIAHAVRSASRVSRSVWSCLQIVSIAEVDERRVARSARALIARGSDLGLATSSSERGGERAPEAGFRAAKPEYRWRARVRDSQSSKGDGASSEHSSMEGASDRTESGPLTGLWRKAVLAAGNVSFTELRKAVSSDDKELVATWGVRGRRALLAPRNTTPRNGGRPFEGSPISEPTRIQGRPQPPDRRRRERWFDRSADRIVKCEPARRVRRR